MRLAHPRCQQSLQASLSYAAAVGAAHARRAFIGARQLVLTRGMFVQKLNPLTGEADWVLVNDPGLGDEGDASADLVATSSYLDMLTDTRRNVAYGAALRRVVPAQQRLAATRAAAAVPGPVGGAGSGAGGSAGDQCAGSGSREGKAAGGSSGSSGGNSGGSGNNGDGGSIRVLDIGTGTGLLAMMAARAMGLHGGGGGGAAEVAAAAVSPSSAGGDTVGGGDAGGGSAPDAPTSAPVVACEVFPPMQNLSRKVIAANGLGRLIRVVNKRSDEIVLRPPPAAPEGKDRGIGAAEATSTAPAAPSAARARAAAAAAAAAGTKAAAAPDMDGLADVIVTEIFDSELLGEGMIPTMRHAVQHLLKEGGVVIPATSCVYGQIVQCSLMHQMTGLRHTAGSGAAGPAWPAGAADGAAAAAAAAVAAAAAERVLGVLGDLDSRARAAAFRGDELYEVREMHVDLLYEHAAAQLTSSGIPVGSTQGSQTRDPDAGGQDLLEPPASAQPAPETTSAAPPPPGLRPLSEPFLVFDFDWLRPPPASGRKRTVQVPVTCDGTAHAVLLWWQLGMTPADRTCATDPQPLHHEAAHQQNRRRDHHHEQQQQQQSQQSQSETRSQQREPAGQPQPAEAWDPRDAPLLLSTAPCWVGGRPEAGGDGGPLEGVAQGWRDHWKQCWAQLADGAVPVRCGEALSLSFEHDDLNIRTKLAGPSSSPPPPSASSAAQPPEQGGGGDGGGRAGRRPQEVLASLQVEAAQQQLMPLLSWLGPQALLQLGDADRLATFGAGLQAALAQVAQASGAADASADAAAAADAPAAAAAAAAGAAGCGAEVVVVDGSLALGLLAATHPAVASVTLLQESNVAAGNWLKASAAALGVSSKVRSIRSDAYFKRLAARAAPAAAPPPPLVLVSEPYFSEFEQLVPWAHLKFWRDYDVTRGSMGPRAGRGVASFPARARLVAVAAALPELWRTRCALDRIEGLDLSAANNVLGVVGGEGTSGSSSSGGNGSSAATGGNGTANRATAADDDADVWGDGSDGDGDDDNSGDGGGGATAAVRQPLPILPYSVWQAGGGYQELSQRRELLSLDCGGHLEDAEGEAVLEATHGSVCHAIVLWMEYDLVSAPAAHEGGNGGENGKTERRLVVSTAPSADGGPGASVQGVYLLKRPVGLTRGSRLHVAAQFDGLDADVTVEVTVLPPLTTE